MKIFTHQPPTKDLPPQAKNVNDQRFYEHLETKDIYPSITSVLSIRDKKGLHEWRQKVGEDVANHVMIQAANRGTAVHNMVEDYLNNVDLDQVEKYQKQFIPRMMFNVLKKECLLGINNIRLQEAQMYSSDYTVAGRCDCIADYDGVPSIIDFKTSTREKNEDWIENYFIQGTAYAEMYKESFDEEINQIVILVVTKEDHNTYLRKTKMITCLN